MRDIIGLPQELFDNGNLECDGCVNYMKSGLVYADRVTTVSPTYAQEITYLLRRSLDGYIRANSGKVSGILNASTSMPTIRKRILTLKSSIL